jgi:hypothetical protein
MNLFAKIINYLYQRQIGQTKTNLELKEYLQEAVIKATESIENLELDYSQKENIQKLIVSQPSEAVLMSFLDDLSNGLLEELCTHFDQAHYEIKDDIAALDFNDFCEITLCIDASRSWLMSHSQDQIGELLKKCIIKYINSPEGKQATNNILMQNSIILQRTVGDA